MIIKSTFKTSVLRTQKESYIYYFKSSLIISGMWIFERDYEILGIGNIHLTFLFYEDLYRTCKYLLMFQKILRSL